MIPGPGGATQDAPDAVRAGEPATVRLELWITEPNRSIKHRYEDVRLRYRLRSETSFKQAPTPEPTIVARDHEWYDFTIPPFPAGTRGEIEYYILFTFDGHPNPPMEGIKHIRVE